MRGKMLNLGCGQERMAGFVNYDQLPIGDVCGNCEQGLPFNDGAFAGILASHVLEHIQDLRSLKLELLRVLKPGGSLVVIVPYYLSPDAWGDDTHCRAFSNQSFFLDFWPGWRLLRLQHQKLTKGNGEEVTWIHAYFEKKRET